MGLTAYQHVDYFPHNAHATSPTRGISTKEVIIVAEEVHSA